MKSAIPLNKHFSQMVSKIQKLRYLEMLIVITVVLISPILTFVPYQKSFQSGGIRQRKTVSRIPKFSYVPDVSASMGSSKDKGFDSDFAEAVSKPLPDWYVTEKLKKEKFMKELEENRKRITEEYKAKYEVTAEVKAKEMKEKWDKIEARAIRKQNEKNEKSKNWLGKVFAQTATRSEKDMDEALDTPKPTTRDAWEKIWDDDEKEPDFYLPGFFEVFPELKLKWPKFSRNKNGQRSKCQVDSDCPFPQACCQHPILPNEKFCCTGWGKRAMVPQYCPQELVSNQKVNGETNQGPQTPERLW
mmetsp:Transcript_40502/g.41332  ORF Transcript_40502/g.41332 Transcript_40502/m.41332 type:complete len:302 (-) Transcript_40502:226-1131(-)